MPDPVKNSTDIRFKLGEVYNDLLVVDSFCRGNTSVSVQANSLLGAKLMEREPMIVSRAAYLAWKRGKTPAEMWLDILAGTADGITTEEIQELRAQGLIDETGDIPGLRTSK